MAHREHQDGGEPDATDGAESAAGNIVSIELLHARYQARLKSYFIRRIAYSSDIDDMVQETFLRIAKPNQLANVQDVEAYLFQVAGNLVLERGRRAATRHTKSHVELDPTFEDARVFTPERILASKEELAAILKALQELPERTRTIFVLQRFEGYTYGEIARQLRVTDSAIDKQMSKALEHLTRRLEQLK